MTKIDDKVQQLSSAGFRLGAPLGPEKDESPAGRSRDFTNATLYFNAGADQVAHEVHGEILIEYRRLGGPSNRALGFPVTDQLRTIDDSGDVSHFESGSIYHAREAKPAVIHGDVKARWTDHGGESSHFGFPIATFETSGGTSTVFERGFLWRRTGDDTVHLATLERPTIGRPSIVQRSGNTPITIMQIRFRNHHLSGLQDLAPPSPPAIAALMLMLQSRFVLRPSTGPAPAVPLAFLTSSGAAETIDVGIAAGQLGLLADRQLYDIGLTRTDGTFHVLAHQAAYHTTQEWETFKFVHVTDIHVAKRLDQFARRLAQNEDTAPDTIAAFNNFNDNLRRFVRWANSLHREGALDFIIATGDLIDYVFEDEDNRHGGGNWVAFKDILRGRSPSPSGVPSERLEVPIFVTLGNHDYRLNAYPLHWSMDIDVEDLVSAIPDNRGALIVTLFLLVANPFVVGPALIALWLGGDSIKVKTITRPEYKNLNLTESEANQLGFKKNNLSVEKAAALLEIDEKLLSDTSFYEREIGSVDSYMLRLGRHRIVMLNTRHDAGVVTNPLDAVFAHFGYGDQKTVNFANGLVNSDGFRDADLALVADAVEEAGANSNRSTVIVGMHAPPIQHRGGEFAHFFRQTEESTESLVAGFVKDRGGDEDSWPVGLNHFFESAKLDSAIGAGIAEGSERFLRIACGMENSSNKRVHLVLCGHGHCHAEYRVGKGDATADSVQLFMDFYMENPQRYLFSLDPSREKNVLIRVRDGTFEPDGGLPVPLAAEDGVLEKRVEEGPLDGSTFEFFRMTVPPFKGPLFNHAVPDVFWTARPYVVQTAALGPLDNTQRLAGQENETVLDPPDPVFQGVRLVQIERDVITRVQWVSLAEIAKVQ